MPITGSISAELRERAQKFFNDVADGPPPPRPRARSPYYQYDDQGRVLPPWAVGDAPRSRVKTTTPVGSIERRVLYREYLLDFVHGDARIGDPTEVKSSCLAFVQIHSSGKPRACKAPFEANEASGDSSVRYGSAAALLGVCRPYLPPTSTNRTAAGAASGGDDPQMMMMMMIRNRFVRPGTTRICQDESGSASTQRTRRR